MSICLKSIMILPLLSFIAVPGYASVTRMPDERPLMTVNGNPVSQEEFRWFMNRQRAAVLRNVRAKCNLDSNGLSWDQVCDGMTLRQMLFTNTVEKVVREKTEQGLFRELGLVEDIRYATFLEILEQMNQQRQRAVEEGKVIYGPIQYTQMQYYGHWMTTMQIRAKDKLRKEQLNITEAKIREYYLWNKNQLKTAGSLTLDTLILRSEQTSASSNKLDALADDIILKVQGGQTVESAAQAYNNSKDFAVIYRKYEQVQDDRLGELFPDSEHFKAIRALSPGRIIRFRTSDNEVWIVQCISVTASHDLPYEQVQDILADRYIDLEYERLIDNRVQNARIKVNQEVLDTIEIQ